MSFIEETKAAQTIGVEWRSDSGQRDILIEDELPGWLDPLWGVYDGWLYLRRPEGIWKARMPLGFADQDTPVLIYQKRAGKPETNNLIGAVRIGSNLAGSLGWVEGVAETDPISAIEFDERPREGLIEANLDGIANDASDWLSPVWVDEPNCLLVAAGDDFFEPPDFALHGDWLLARERRSGWTMAYLMEPGDLVADALVSGKLWLRWAGPWRDAIEVRVVVESK